MTLRRPLVSVRLHGLERSTLGYGVTIPDDVDPGACDWSWIRDLEVIVIRRKDSEERLQDALTAIKHGRPRRLIVLDVGDARVLSILAPDVDHV